MDGGATAEDVALAASRPRAAANCGSARPQDFAIFPPSLVGKGLAALLPRCCFRAAKCTTAAAGSARPQAFDIFPPSLVGKGLAALLSRGPVQPAAASARHQAFAIFPPSLDQLSRGAASALLQRGQILDGDRFGCTGRLHSQTALDIIRGKWTTTKTRVERTGHTCNPPHDCTQSAPA